jgi:hypothetical protein
MKSISKLLNAASYFPECLGATSTSSSRYPDFNNSFEEFVHRHLKLLSEFLFGAIWKSTLTPCRFCWAVTLQFWADFCLWRLLIIEIMMIWN